MGEANAQCCCPGSITATAGLPSSSGLFCPRVLGMDFVPYHNQVQCKAVCVNQQSLP